MQLPFTREQFFDLVVAYNEALWSAVVALWTASAVVAALRLSTRQPHDRRVAHHVVPPRALTSPSASSILSFVTLLRRLTSALLCVGLLAGNVAMCAGWAATPEARMACCAEGAECPMHKRDSHDSGSRHVLTQAEADACCAASEGDNSSPLTPMFVAAISVPVLGPGVVMPAIVPALVLSDAWRTVSPIPTPPVSRHVLLSVFLV